MKTSDILEKIVEHGGSCDWIPVGKWSQTCTLCPMSKLQKTENGKNFVSCHEAVVGNNTTTEEAYDELYLKKAQELLSDIYAEEMLIMKLTNPIETDINRLRNKEQVFVYFMVTVIKCFSNEVE